LATIMLVVNGLIVTAVKAGYQFSLTERYNITSYNSSYDTPIGNHNEL